jgi:hypothetical protein
MASSDANRPSTAIPEADRWEQEQPADPQASSEQGWPASLTPDADEADTLEQVMPVLTDPDEEYPPATA